MKWLHLTRSGDNVKNTGGSRNFPIVVVGLATFALIVIAARRLPNAGMLAIYVLLATISLLVYFRIRILNREQSQSKDDRASVLFKGAFVFLCGGIYGIWLNFHDGWNLRGILILAVPFGIATLAMSRGFALLKARQPPNS
jgi:hypothetical protein